MTNHRLGAARSMLATALLLWGCISPLEAHTADPRTIGLVDQSGDSFRLADLRGRPALLTFVATRCTDACPIANAAFLRLAARLRHDRIDARLVTITLDPEYDTPFVMARLARSIGIPGREWTFASGRPADVRRLMRAFGVTAQNNARGVPELHSSFVYVLSADVKLSRTLLLSTNLPADAEEALNEFTASHSKK